MDNLKEYDLVIYDHGNKHFCLGRIVKITPFTSEGIDAYWVEVQDIKMLSNDSTYDDYHLEVVPRTVLSVTIKKSFGNISINEFIESYPEWQI